VPKFEKFLAEKEQIDLLCIPRYLASYMDGENDFLILEDASCLGFGPASRQSCIDWTECAMIVKTLAKFHAISFAYKDQKKEEFAEATNYLKETYFSRHHWNWYEELHVCNILLYFNQILLQFFRLIFLRLLFSKFYAKQSFHY